MNNFVKTIINPLGTKKFWWELIIMTVGMSFGAASIYYFLLPSNLILGHVSGFCMVLASLAAKFGIILKVSYIVTLINIVLLILAWFLIGKEFGIKTMYTAIILGPLMDFWEWVMPYQKLMEPGATSVMGDLWFDLLCFTLLVSISQVILFNLNASTGGMDIVAKIMNKYLHYDIGTCITLSGLAICVLAFSINPFRLVVIGLIGTWINGVAVDYFTAGLNKRKRVCIISKDYEKIRKYIIEDLVRGCSLYKVVGGYSKEEGVEIQALLTQTEFSALLNFMKENNIHSFTTAGNVSEIYGLWHHNRR